MDDHHHGRNEASRSFDAESTSASLEEKDGLLESGRHMAARRATRPRSCVFLFVILALSNIILIALVFLDIRAGHNRARAGQQHARPPLPLGGIPHVDLTPSWLPPEQWRTEIFREQKIYGVEPSGAAKEAWRSLIPKGKGFVKIKNGTGLGHLPGFHHPEREEQQACVAVFHQLHCLYMTYAAYWDARAGRFDDVPPNHLIHCWDYLRQSIMCAGDTSLEWVSKHQPRPNATTGWGFRNTCKNYDAIFDWAEQHRSKENAGIE